MSDHGAQAVRAAASQLKHCTVEFGDQQPGPGLRIALAGHLDGEAAGIIMDPLVELITSWERGLSVVVDLSRLEYVASLGIGMLTTMAVAARKRGIDFVLQDPRPSVLNVLQLLGITEFLPIRRTGA